MTRIEAWISNIASRWLDARQHARTYGGGPVYWLFGYLGFFLLAQIGIQWVQRRDWLMFPWDFLIPGLMALLWVRSAPYRLRPFKMFALTFLALIVLAEAGVVS